MTQLSWIDHLTELRSRLIYCLGIITLCIGVCYYKADFIFQTLLQPLHQALGDRIRVSYWAPHEAFFTYMSLSFYSGLMLSFPFLSFHLWRFIAPGLYYHEKKLVLPFLLATPIMFIIGICVAYFYVFPTALVFFADFQFHTTGQEGSAALVQETRIQDYTKFALGFLFAFGISFELPIVLLLLGVVGIVTLEQLKRWRKLMMMVLGIFAAIVTPPDVISLVSLWIPLCFLYEASIWILYFIRPRNKNDEVEIIPPAP